MNEVKQEFEKLMTWIDAAIPGVLQRTGEQMREDLRRHIQDDVYDQWNPTRYLRRADNPSLGTPLIDVDTNVNIEVKGHTLVLDYEPDGYNSAYVAGKDYIPLNGNALIATIERGQFGVRESNADLVYDWQKVPPRPFFSNFLQEEIDGQQAARYFSEAMTLALGALGVELVGEFNIERDGTEPEF